MSRQNELKAMLEGRKRELSSELNARKRDAHARNAATHDRNSEHHIAEPGSTANIELALIQLKSETLNRIDAALKKLAQGTYGNCVECADPISKERLSALPFAVRCTGCEQRREAAARRQPVEQRRAYVGIVSEISA
jgi:RNA polymerase-binding transcription factor DksA